MAEVTPESTADINETVSRFLRIGIRRRWWIIGPAPIVAIATIIVLFQLPNRFTSEATLLVIQQQVPERYVVPTSTTDISQALEGMTQEVLSRPRLLSIIDELGLYAGQRQTAAPEQLVALMRRDVAIKPLQKASDRREINAFRISFIADTPQMAQQVTSRLTTLFIEQNLKTRSDQANTTTRFLREQLADARQKLTDQEQRLRDFKMQYLGELPEQQAGNLGILAGLQSQLTNVMGNLNRARQQRLYVESLLDEYQRLASRGLAVVAGSSGETPGMTALQTAQRDLARLEADKRRLLTTYTAHHPDVLSKEQEIRSQQQLVDRLSAASAAMIKEKNKDAGAPPAPAPEAREDTAATAQLKSQLESNRLEIEDLQKSEEKLKAEIDKYQSRLNLTPVREQQLTAILRDHELTRLQYADLLKKESESQLAASLEKQQEGQQFRMTDPPNLPARPSSPDRIKFSLMGVGAGLAVGLALAALAEVRDASFHGTEEMTVQVPVAMIVAVPALRTATERRMRRWRVLAECCAASVLLFALGLAGLYVYKNG